MNSKFWNKTSVIGFINSIYLMGSSLINTIQDRLSTFFWSRSLKNTGKNTIIQKGVSIRFPGSISVGRNSNIGRGVAFSTEIITSVLTIGEHTQINKDVTIDFSGSVFIGDNVVISSGTKIFSHSHGYNPKSSPIGKPLKIENNVWIGSNCLILENVEYIKEGVIIAAGSVVTKNVEANTIIGGNPAKLIKHK